MGVRPPACHAPSVACMQSKESARNWICGLALATGRISDNDRIDRFFNSLMRPPGGRRLPDLGVGPRRVQHEALRPCTARVHREGQPHDTPAFLENGIFLRPLEPEYEKKYIDLWEEVQAGM